MSPAMARPRQGLQRDVAARGRESLGTGEGRFPVIVRVEHERGHAGLARHVRALEAGKLAPGQALHMGVEPALAARIQADSPAKAMKEPGHRMQSGDQRQPLDGNRRLAFHQPANQGRSDGAAEGMADDAMPWPCPGMRRL